jgi:hypothetical protein
MRPVDFSIIMLPSWTTSRRRNLRWISMTGRWKLRTIKWKWFNWKTTWSNMCSKRRTIRWTSEPNITMVIYWSTTPNIKVLRWNSSIRIRLEIPMPFLYSRPHTILIESLIVSSPRINSFTLRITMTIIYNTTNTTLSV